MARSELGVGVAKGGLMNFSQRIAMLMLASMSALAQADLIDDVQAGTNMNFDLIGLNYTYSGAQSGSGVVTDPEAPPTCAPKPAGALSFTLNSSALGLPFSVNIPLTGAKLSPTRVRWTTDVILNQTVTGTLNGQSVTVLIRRVNGQLTANASGVDPFRDAICNQGYNVRMDDTGSNADSFLNAETYLFGIVSPLFRIDFQMRDIDTVGFGGVPRGIFKASSYSIVNGTPFGGNLASLGASDDDRLIVLNEEGDPNATVEVTATSPGESPSSLTLIVEASVSRTGLSQFVDAYKYATNSFQNVDFSVGTLADSTRTALLASPAASGFIQAGTCEVKARIRWIPFEDVEAADGWSESLDRVVWDSVP